MQRPSRLGRLLDRYGLWIGLSLALVLLGGSQLAFNALQPVVREQIDAVQDEFRASDCYRAGWNTLTAKTAAVEELGGNLRQEGFIQGSMPLKTNQTRLETFQGQALLLVPVEGDRKQAILEIRCTAELGEWQLDSVLLTNPSQKIHWRLYP